MLSHDVESRWYVAVAVVCVLALAVRTTYELLKKDGRVDTHGKAVFTVVFVAMSCMLASWPAMCRLDPARLALGAGQPLIGGALVAAALGLAFGGLAQLRGLEDVDHLVTSGLYAHLRHPMYVGFVLWIVGWVVLHGALVSAALAVVAVVNIALWRRLEESALLGRYGERYRAYRAATWF
jgi:protein-S-isoprenylcysteine O-methyltransferase Ste14